uniref:B30.2/SPRY domain-containing protein n=1 Tax=Neolamprologus brichardi TaxID=32507 RepID=A0A3Q4HDG5_NEOBR
GSESKYSDLPRGGSVGPVNHLQAHGKGDKKSYEARWTIFDFPHQSSEVTLHSPSFKMHPVKYFECLQTVMSEIRDKLREYLSEKWSKISLTVRSVDVLLPRDEPKTKDEFLKHSCKLTLDPDVVHTKIFLSNQKRTVSNSSDYNTWPQKRAKFTIKQQVLSKEKLIGPCYWEVEWRGHTKNEHKLDQSGFGYNNASWALECYKKTFKFRHNNITIPISGPLSSKVGVYVDPRAGVLSFYSLSDTMALLHRVQTTFTEPLYAGLWIWGGYFTSTTATLNEMK